MTVGLLSAPHANGSIKNQPSLRERKAQEACPHMRKNADADIQTMSAGIFENCKKIDCRRLFLLTFKGRFRLWENIISHIKYLAHS